MNNDRITELYEGEIGPPDSQRRARTRVHWLCAQVQGELVLDIGCSQGIASILLAREGHRVFAVDVEDAALEFARERVDREEPHVADRITITFADGGELPYEDASFDTVLLGEVIEHQLEPARIVREARRVLNTDGTLVLTTPYGIFRYADHKEPIYLRAVLELLAEGFLVERIELMEKWLGVVARAVPKARAGITQEALEMALEAAETRLMQLDSGLEERSEALKATQARLQETRKERDKLKDTERRAAEADADRAALVEVRDELLALGADHRAVVKELEATRARLEEIERRETAAHTAQMEAERGQAAAEGRAEAAAAELGRHVERADRATAELASAREREAQKLAEARDLATRRIAEAREEAAREAAEAREQAARALADARQRITHLEATQQQRDASARAANEEAATLAERLAETEVRTQAVQLELDAAQRRIRRLETDQEAQEQDRDHAYDRAAELERRAAMLEVELEEARGRVATLERELGDARRRGAEAPVTAGPVARAAGHDLLAPLAPGYAGLEESGEPAPAPLEAPATAVALADPPGEAELEAEEEAQDAEPPNGAPPAPGDEGAAGLDMLPGEEEDPRALAKAAQERYKAGDFPAAVEVFRRAATLEPDKGGHWFGLARALRNLKLYEEAIDAVQSALAARPGWRDAVWVALLCASRLERTEAFLDYAADLGPLDDLDAKDLERLAPLALRAGAHALALDAGERLRAADPDGRPGLEIVAAALWELEREAEAEELIESALSGKHPAGVRAALSFARHTDRLDPVPDLLLMLDPPELDQMLGFAQTFLRRGDPLPALRILDLAEAVDPGDPRIVTPRARAEELERLHDGSWAPPRTTRALEPVKGRVLHLVSHSLPHHTSGGTYRTHYIAKAQRDAGLDPHLVTQIGFPWFAGKENAAMSDLVDGIPYRRLRDDEPDDPGPDRRLQRALAGLIPLVEELRPAVLHPASDYLNAMLALELREIFGIPVIYEVRGFPEERLVRRPGSRVLNDPSVGRRALELKCMAAADRIVTLAEVMRGHMASRGIDEGKVRIVPNGVDPETLQPVERDDERARALGIADDETVLGYVSTFHGYEGIQFIIEATAHLRERGRKARALLVGDGRERGFLERRARELGVEDAVIFTGRVPHGDVLTYYGLIDLFIVPRRAEATSELVTPLKPFEAMGVARTVIVSDVAALREVVEDGVTGRTFRPEDSRHLADVAEELIDDPQERRRLAQAAHEWVTRERTWEGNGRRYVELYRELGVAD